MLKLFRQPVAADDPLAIAEANLAALRAEGQEKHEKIAAIQEANKATQVALDREAASGPRAEALREARAQRIADAELAGETIDCAALDRELEQAQAEHRHNVLLADVAREKRRRYAEHMAQVQAELNAIHQRAPRAMYDVLHTRLAAQAEAFAVERKRLVDRWSHVVALCCAADELAPQCGGQQVRPRSLSEGLFIPFPQHPAFGPVTEWPDFKVEARAILDGLIRR